MMSKKSEEKLAAAEARAQKLMTETRYRPYHRDGVTYQPNGARETVRGMLRLEKASAKLASVDLSTPA